ncbi:endonuclease/exonuclease/phosphatase family protein, partial [Trifolium medium]|nr:endonuclease/exonuclease/phosphatase family protein [Trifolium medium]
FTNFPEEASSEELWVVFRKYGRVAEVYIPKKLDKWGRRFGFVKFKEVNEVEVLGERLKDVWLGTFKLRVNRARFGRSEVKDEIPRKSEKKRQAINVEVTTPGKSFRTALLGIREEGSSSRETLCIKASVNEAFLKELKGSMVVTLARERDVRRIRTTLFMEGFQSIRVTHMGGNMALLCSSVEGDIAKLVRSKNECLDYYFSEMKPWEPGLFAKHRELWVQVYG